MSPCPVCIRMLRHQRCDLTLVYLRILGLAGKAKTMFRVVVSVAPPFVMESSVNEEGQCLRGLICYQIYTTGRHNLTLMFNEIERRNRLREIQPASSLHLQEEPRQKYPLYR